MNIYSLDTTSELSLFTSDNNTIGIYILITKFEAFIIHIIHASSASMLIIRHAFYLSEIKQSKKYQVNELIKLNDIKVYNL